MSIRQCTDGSAERTSRHGSTPLPSGSRTSSTAIGFGGQDAHRRLPDRRGLADDLQVGGGAEITQSAPDQLVVVDEIHTARAGVSLPGT